MHSGTTSFYPSSRPGAVTTARAFLLVAGGGLRLALPVEAVGEIHRAARIDALPGAPAGVDGLANLRGRPLPVLDLRGLSGQRSIPNSPDQQFVTILSERRPVLLRVDRALDVVRLDPQSFHPVPVPLEGGDCLTAVAAMEDDLLVVLDPERVLSPEAADRLARALAVVEGADG